MSDNIIGVERTLTDIGPLAKWNKKRLRWVITHNTPNFTRQHIIDLQMVIVSSERVIKVDNQIKHQSMASFGFNQQFQISNKLKGKIQQDGITFQLYVNGQSFTDISKKQYGYEPIQLEANFYEPKAQQKYSSNNSLKPNNNPFVFKPQPKKQEKNPEPIKVQKHNKFTLKDPPKTQDALKSAQDELMKIMIQQKKKKKELQNKMTIK